MTHLKFHQQGISYILMTEAFAKRHCHGQLVTATPPRRELQQHSLFVKLFMIT